MSKSRADVSKLVARLPLGPGHELQEQAVAAAAQQPVVRRPQGSGPGR